MLFGQPKILGECSSIYSQFHYSCRLPGGKLFIEEILIRATIPTWAAVHCSAAVKEKHVTVLASVAAPPCEKVVEQMILPCQPPPCNDTCESVSHSPSCANYMRPNTWSSSPLNTSQAFVTSFSLVMSFFLAAAGKTYLISGFRIFTTWPNTCMYLISANPKMSCVEENKL